MGVAGGSLRKMALASRRAIAAALIAALVCVATIAVLSYTDSALPDEGIIAESAGKPKLDVLKNIIKLKAYCLSAWDDARLVANQYSGKYSAITDFTLMYGQEGGGVSRGGRTEGVGNIVTEYAQVVAALRVKYPKGVNKYILDNIDRSVRHDVNGVIFEKHSMDAFGSGGNKGKKIGHLVALRKEALGLTDTPGIVVQLASKYAPYLHFKTVASKQATDADAIAATLFLKSKGSGQYTSFLQREIAKVYRKMRHDFKHVAKAAFEAEEGAFEKAYTANRKAYFKHVQVQTPASVKAAKGTAAGLKWSPPSLAEMKKIAAANAKKFMAKYKAKASDTSKLIKQMVDEAGGVKIFITTTGASNAQSTMQPKVEFVGKNRALKSSIRSLPGQGLSSALHFPTANPIGSIEKVILTGTGKGTSWNCDSFKVRVGNQEADIVPMIPKGLQKSFWLKSGEQLELVPDHKAVTSLALKKRGCLKWHATKDCDANGKPDPSNNKGCTEDIDSGSSGYCKCDTGAVAKVDCGHATFTCDQMCSN